MAFILSTLSFFVAAAEVTNTLDEQLVTGSNGFGFDLTDEIYADSSTNIWISPFCIASCFALIYPGSNGNTQTQIGQVLGYPLNTNSSDITQAFLALQLSIESTYAGPYTISEGNDVIERIATIIGIANKIYVAADIQLKQSYVDALSYQNEAFIEYNFNFDSNDAKNTMNSWVSDSTNGLIDSIIDETTDISDWKLAALNAIYLNGTFTKQFDEDMTSSSKFYSDESRATESVSDIHLMHQIDSFAYYNNGDYQFLKFEFDNWDADLFVLFALPINNDLYSTNNALITDYTLIDDAITNLQSTRIALAIPRISIEIKYELNENLKHLGILDAFDLYLADFSAMSDAPLLIDKVIHKTMIEMDEKGLVSAAVTVIGMIRKSIQIEPDPILFKADHPFQMFIIDGAHNNNILFMGQINNPGIVEGSNDPIFDESISDVWDDYDSYRTEAPTPTNTVGETSTAISVSGPENSVLKLCLGYACLVTVLSLL